jgi:hypothetical protein
MLKLKIKNKLPEITSKNNINPKNIKIKFICKRGKKAESNNITALKSSFENNLIAYNIPVFLKSDKFDYNAMFNILPSIDQTSTLKSLVKFNTNLKSMRTNIRIKLVKNEKIILNAIHSDAAVNISKEQATQNAIIKTGKKAVREIVKTIIKDQYKLKLK